jgi:AraC-like DNA-binding protein
MKLENLRNKYKHHSLIKPIIDYCERNNLGFELTKETRPGEMGIKGIKYFHNYYMKIGDNLIATESKLWYWNDLIKLIAEAYKYIGLEYPENLVKAARAFRKQI